MLHVPQFVREHTQHLLVVVEQVNELVDHYYGAGGQRKCVGPDHPSAITKLNTVRNRLALRYEHFAELLGECALPGLRKF